MKFGFPEAWWAVVGLGVPLIIHLLSKKKKTIVDFGSLIFLQPSESASSKSLYLSDIWLLLVRALLIGTTIFLIAKLLVPESVDRQSRVFVEDHIAKDNAYQSLHKQWQEADQTEYFTFDNTLENDESTYYQSAYSLIAGLNKTEDSITVYTHSLHKHFKGSEVQLRRGIRWIIVPKEAGSEDPVTDPTLAILPIYVHQGQNEAIKRLVTIINAMTPSLNYEVQWTNEKEEALLEFSLDGQKKKPSIPSIQLKPGDHPLSIDQLSPYHIKISGNLNNEELLHSNLPLILAGFSNKIIADSNLDDMRTTEPKYENQTRIALAHIGRKPIHRSWWLILILILLLERYLSYKSALNS